MGKVRAAGGHVIQTRFTNRASGQDATMKEQMDAYDWRIFVGPVDNPTDYASVMGEHPTDLIRRHLGSMKGAAVLRVGDKVTLFRTFWGGDTDRPDAPIFLAFDELSRQAGRSEPSKSGGGHNGASTHPNPVEGAKQGAIEGSRQGAKQGANNGLNAAQHAREEQPPFDGLPAAAWDALAGGPLSQSALISQLGCSANSFRSHVRDNPLVAGWLVQSTVDPARRTVSWARADRSVRALSHSGTAA
jgi:hypothetical protein